MTKPDKDNKVMSRIPKEENPIYEDQETKNIWHEQSTVVAGYLNRESKDGYHRRIGDLLLYIMWIWKMQNGSQPTEGCSGEG